MNSELRDVMALLEKATEGKWKADKDDVYSEDGGVGNIVCERTEWPVSSEKWPGNAAAIAAAVNFLRKHGESLLAETEDRR